MAESLPLILTLASGAVSAISSISQGASQSAAANYNAKVANRNAQIAIDQGNQDAAAQKRRAVMSLGDARSLYGASGVTAEGSPLDVLASSAAAAEQDNQTIKYRARLRALGYQDTANLDEASASQYLTSGFTGAIGAALGAGVNAYSNGLLDTGSPSGGYTGAESAGTGSSY